MAIAETDRRTDPIVATGGELLLPYPFRVLAARDIAVQMSRGGRLYSLILGYDYTVEGVGEFEGGNVRLARAALAGDTYVIEGRRPQERATDIAQQKILDARFLNHELDSLQIQLQELRRDISGIVSRLPADLLLPPINTPVPDPHDEYLKKLITGAYDMLGSAGQIGREATDWAQRTAEASIRDLLGQIEGKTGYTQDLKIQVDRNGALVQMVETLQATVEGDISAALQNEAQVRANADGALAQTTETLQARIGTAEEALETETAARLAAVQAEAQARADADGALATTQQELLATLGTKASTASVTTVAEAQAATANGLAEVRAFYGVVVQAGGRLGFFKLDGTPGEINAIFGVDKFIVVDAAGGTKTPFVTGFIDGVSTTTLGNLIADNYIVGRHINAVSVTAAIISAVKAQIDELIAIIVRSNDSTAKLNFATKMLDWGKFHVNGATGEWWVDA